MVETARQLTSSRSAGAHPLPDPYALPEPGDRWEWFHDAAAAGGLSLRGGPAILFQMLSGPVCVIGPGGDGPAAAAVDAGGAALRTVDPVEWPGPGVVRLECVDTDPWTFRLEPVDAGLAAAPTVDADDDRILRAAVAQPPASPRAFAVSLEAGRLATVAGFDQLLGLPLVRQVERLEHQLQTVRTVLRRFRGRALLCDEVGLGKTVEAGLVLLELLVRGLAQRVLILTPPSLVEQWKGEMARKFGLDFTAQDETAFRARRQEAWSSFPRVIASFHTAKRSPHREAMTAQPWDVVIIDEAHHLRNRRTLLWQMASQLRKNYILLLTATPVQNDLEELFNLVTLLDPGLLGTQRRFAHDFVDPRDGMVPRNVEGLHRLLAEVMVRNRRSTIGFQFTRRIAHTERVEPDPAERDLYREVSRFVRGRLRPGDDGGGRQRLSRVALLALQKELGSTPLAAAPTLERLALAGDLAEGEAAHLSALAQAARRLRGSAKVEALVRTVTEFGDPMVVFTQFLESQRCLAGRLKAAGVPTWPFHGGLTRLQKEAVVESFRQRGGVLLSTDTGSEGRNLQFCHAVCNFDLPWNPMRIEQRIGRLSRIGQTRDVYVFNLVAAGTLEEAILHLLEAKINMFELVVGEVDMILGNWQGDGDAEFEDAVVSLWAESGDETEFGARLEDLGTRLMRARDAYLAQRAYDDQLFGDALQPT